MFYIIQSPGRRIHKAPPEEVLIVDASRQTINPDESEVDIQIGFERSPVRVICHSPNSLESGFRYECMSDSTL